jgi:hypothetical protein
MALKFIPAHTDVPGGYDSWIDPAAPDWIIVRYEGDLRNEDRFCLMDPDGIIIQQIYPTIEAAHADMLQRARSRGGHVSRHH